MRSALVLCLFSILILVSADLAESAYQGFSDPIDVFSLSSYELEFAEGEDTILIGLASEDDAVYEYGYISYDGSGWNRFTLSGDALGGSWLMGPVSAEISVPKDAFGMSTQRNRTDKNFIVVYSCTRSRGSWDCHGGWQIVQFNASLEIGPYCGDAKCNGNETCSDCSSDCQCPEGFDCIGGTCVEEGSGEDIEIVYFNNFEQDTLGPYLQAEYEHDWQLASFITGYNTRFHESSIYSNPSDTVNPTKVFRNDFGAGHYWCNWNDCFNGEHYLDEGYEELYLSYKMKWSDGYQGSKGKIPSLRGQITNNGSGAGQCVTGVDDFSGRFMFYGGYGATYLHFYPYHMQNWNGSFYSDAFYQSRGVYPKDCYEVMEYVCYNWYCRVSDIWNSAPFASELSKFAAAHGRDPTSTLEFAIFIQQREYYEFINKYGRAPAECLEFVLFVRHNHDTSLCGVYSGSGRAAERTEMESNVWHLITQRVVVNDVGHANGFVEIFIDGVFADRLTGLEFRSVEGLKLNSIGFDGYFGGDEQDAPSQDVRMYIDDVIAYYYAPGSGEPIGHAYSPEGRVLPEIEYPQYSMI